MNSGIKVNYQKPKKNKFKQVRKRGNRPLTSLKRVMERVWGRKMHGGTMAGELVMPQTCPIAISIFLLFCKVLSPISSLPFATIKTVVVAFLPHFFEFCWCVCKDFYVFPLFFLQLYLHVAFFATFFFWHVTINVSATLIARCHVLL